MRFIPIQLLVLGSCGLASAAAAPPAAGSCQSGYYWDSGYGCTKGPPPTSGPGSRNRCSSKQYWDSRKGCCSGPPPAPPKLSCPAFTALVSLVHGQQQATAFCSSYLHIPVATATATVTPNPATSTTTSTVTSGTVVQTVATVTEISLTTEVESTTVTVPVVTTETPTSYGVYTSTRTTCAPAPSSMSAKKKRAVPSIASPPFLPTGLAAPAVSSLCSCLSIQPSTTTATVTAALVTTTETRTVPSTAYTTAVETSIQTVTVTTVIEETGPVATVTYPSTVTSYTSTTQVLAIPKFAIQAQGGDNDGHYVYAESNDSPVRLYNNRDTPSLFSIDDNSVLTLQSGPYAGGQIVQAPRENPSAPYQTYISHTGDLDTRGPSNLTCQLQPSDDGTCPFRCNGLNGGTTSWDCLKQFWRLGQLANKPSSCIVFTPIAVTL